MFEIPNFWKCSSDTGVGRRCKRLNRSEPFLHERYQGFWWGHGHRRTVSEKGSCTFGVYRKKMLRRTCWKTLLLPRLKKPNSQIPNQLGWPSSIVQLVGLSNWRVQIYNMGCDIGFGIGFCNAGWADDVSSPKKILHGKGLVYCTPFKEMLHPVKGNAQIDATPSQTRSNFWNNVLAGNT